MPTDTTDWSDLSRAQSCGMQQQLEKEVRNNSSKEECWSALLGQWVRKSTIWLRDWATQQNHIIWFYFPRKPIESDSEKDQYLFEPGPMVLYLYD